MKGWRWPSTFDLKYVHVRGDEHGLKRGGTHTTQSRSLDRLHSIYVVLSNDWLYWYATKHWKMTGRSCMHGDHFHYLFNLHFHRHHLLIFILILILSPKVPNQNYLCIIHLANWYGFTTLEQAATVYFHFPNANGKYIYISLYNWFCTKEQHKRACTDQALNQYSLCISVVSH